MKFVITVARQNVVYLWGNAYSIEEVPITKNKFNNYCNHHLGDNANPTLASELLICQ